MAERLSDSEIDERLATSRWGRQDDALVRDFELGGFTAAMAFANAVAEAAEHANHHPDILIHDYKHVRLTISTHSAGGITHSDFALAGMIDGFSTA
ncbi:MAG TPA: 4a-hydroxytetrahydrobiopterin dehydratase [Solirubrobacteraceae bacterium]|nr:4a-hydroxytetrahydrobiopterin dehydratase [Solirubrobacteraceae bacterium]